MYMNFYNLSKAPFHITPDPDFLFLSPSHKEGLGAIIYCVEERKGFVSVVGEVGTGKTTIIRSFLARCDRKLVKPIYVFNAAVTFQELLKTIFHELGIERQNEDVYAMYQQLHLFLINEYKNGHNIVLIIDEAQHMPVDTLEKLRLLSNFETSKEKLIQIVLVGQPELNDKLKLHELRQLNQRLAVRATLRPLTTRESHEYILHRLSKLTPNPEKIFAPAALERIVKTCQGSPRRLNILCDNVLVAGFGYREKQISEKITKQVIADFEGRGKKRFLNWRLAAAASFFVLCLILGIAANDFFRSSFPDMVPKLAGGRKAAPDKAPSRIVMANLAPLASAHPAGGAIEKKGLEQENSPAEKRPYSVEGTASSITPASEPEDKMVNDSSSMAVQADSEADVSLTTAIAIEELGGQKEETGSTPTPQGSDLLTTESATEGGMLEREIVSPPTPPRQEGEEIISTVRTIKQGEYLSQICLEVYGYYSDPLIQKIKENNPNIHNADLIVVGEQIVFPELLKHEEKELTFKEDRDDDQNF